MDKVYIQTLNEFYQVDLLPVSLTMASSSFMLDATVLQYLLLFDLCPKKVVMGDSKHKN